MIRAQFLTRSSLDSDRFGLSVVRGDIPEGAPENAVLLDVNRLAPDVAIFRCAAGDTSQINALYSAGLQPIHADTLVYYSAEIGGIKTSLKPEQGEEIGAALRDDSDMIREVAKLAFSGYRSHYHANPRFDRERILAGYIEWSSAYTRAHSGLEVRVARQAGQVTGFAMFKVDSRRAMAEVVLNAVHPNHMGRGVYQRIFSALANDLCGRGITALEISTQVWNSRVQRAWVRLGLLPDHAVDTYHVNVPVGFMR